MSARVLAAAIPSLVFFLFFFVLLPSLTHLSLQKAEQPRESILTYFGSQREPATELEGVNWAEFDDDPF